MIEEFSHTVLHGENFKAKLQNNNALVRPPSSSRVNGPTPRPPTATPIEFGGPQPRQASSVMRRPSPCPANLVQKSSDKKLIDNNLKRPLSANRLSENNRRPINNGYKESFLEQVKRQEEEAAALKKKQQELAEKQKVINFSYF